MASSQPHPPHVYLGFHFNGSGNIGDDLMLDGFLEGCDRLLGTATFEGLCWDEGATLVLSRRFPRVRWLPWRNKATGPVAGEIWAGVGGTVFQATSGKWIRDYLLERQEQIAGFRHRILVGVGAESEIEADKEAFGRIAAGFDRIGLRDDSSGSILSGLPGADPGRIFCGADLANLPLARFARGGFPAKCIDLGVTVVADTLSQFDVKALSIFLSQEPGKVSFIANDVRDADRLERSVFRKLSLWSRFSGKLSLQIPDYERGSLADLVGPLAQCRTVLSNRYHGLLIAAWAGCRLGAIGRSSKIVAVAQTLGIPHVDLPLSPEKLGWLKANACTVSSERLAKLEVRAWEGLQFAIGSINPNSPKMGLQH